MSIWQNTYLTEENRHPWKLRKLGAALSFGLAG
jgi:hypothetical protein